MILEAICSFIHHELEAFISYLCITGCELHEFQCNATNCIDMIRRCDNQIDCEGGVDEIHCGMK